MAVVASATGTADAGEMVNRVRRSRRAAAPPERKVTVPLHKSTLSHMVTDTRSRSRRIAGAEAGAGRFASWRIIGAPRSAILEQMLTCPTAVTRVTRILGAGMSASMGKDVRRCRSAPTCGGKIAEGLGAGRSNEARRESLRPGESNAKNGCGFYDRA